MYGAELRFLSGDGDKGLIHQYDISTPNYALEGYKFVKSHDLSAYEVGDVFAYDWNTASEDPNAISIL